MVKEQARMMAKRFMITSPFISLSGESSCLLYEVFQTWLASIFMFYGLERKKFQKK